MMDASVVMDLGAADDEVATRQIAISAAAIRKRFMGTSF
jgi:hypothetical protein